MVLGRGADPDSIYIRMIDDLHGIISELRHIELLRSLLSLYIYIPKGRRVNE